MKKTSTVTPCPATRTETDPGSTSAFPAIAFLSSLRCSSVSSVSVRKREPEVVVWGPIQFERVFLCEKTLDRVGVLHAKCGDRRGLGCIRVSFFSISSSMRLVAVDFTRTSTVSLLPSTSTFSRPLVSQTECSCQILVNEHLELRRLLGILVVKTSVASGKHVSSRMVPSTFRCSTAPSKAGPIRPIRLCRRSQANGCSGNFPAPLNWRWGGCETVQGESEQSGCSPCFRSTCPGADANNEGCC